MLTVDLGINYAGSLNEEHYFGLSNRRTNNERANLREVKANELKLLYFFMSDRKNAD